MKKDLSISDQQILKQLLEKGRRIEAELSQGRPVPEKSFFELTVLFGELQLSNNPEVSRLSGNADHLFPAMSLRHFLNFLIPVERLLDRSLRDDDILVMTEDKLLISVGDHAQKIVTKRPLVFVLHNLRSAFNVGSLFRLAETLAVSEIHLAGYTPGPDSEGVRKTAMGTEALVGSKHFQTIDHSLAVLREQGYQLVALETATSSLSLYTSPLPTKVAFVVGNERFGLDYQVLDHCDEVRHIPLLGQKNSLNVSSALSAAAFEWHRQNLETT